MKQLSRWARHHKWSARLLIIGSWIILTVLGIFIGRTLIDLGTLLPGWVFALSTGIFILTVCIYPFASQRKKPRAVSFYTWQKSCDLVVAVVSFVLVIYVANKPALLFRSWNPVYAANSSTPVLPRDSASKNYLWIKDFSASMKGENNSSLKWKERKKLLKAQVKAIKKSPDLSQGEKTLLIILSVLVAMGLLFLVGSLACNLSCAGSDAAAVIVGVGGTALVIWLLVVVIRSIMGKKRRKKIVVPEPAAEQGPKN